MWMRRIFEQAQWRRRGGAKWMRFTWCLHDRTGAASRPVLTR